MSFSEDLARFGDRLARLVDAGVTVNDAAAELGIEPQRCYAILRARGYRVGTPKRRSDPVLRERIRLAFNETGSVNQAAQAVGVSHPMARRILVAAGLVSAIKARRGKPEARKRFLELVEAGWSTARAADEVGVNVRTARAWRDGVRKSLNSRRIRVDGTVAEISDEAPVVISDRYLSLPDRLVIADGLAVGLSVTEIAARIGKHKSTVSREARAHRVQGLYLPYQAHRQASLARARPKTVSYVVVIRFCCVGSGCAA
ncbi:helix-turn-helix domain-containing protein [Nocardia sp. NPDC051570]|uniref:helix-turn-helix domain-containing protein n=1 Tax=Nocardia sp. NPDC051570 TaxID=3364324 RepID=UPI0037B3C1CA